MGCGSHSCKNLRGTLLNVSDSIEVPIRALPRGPHGLSREEVTGSQSERMLWAMTEAVSEKGYTATTVADVISRAGVSRTTFYQIFTDKLACFLAANEIASAMLIAHLENEINQINAIEGLTLPRRLERLLSRYLEAIEELALFAKVYLVEVYAAGTKAVEQRRRLLGRFIDMVVDSGWTDGVEGIDREEMRAITQIVVSAVSLQATTALAVDDLALLKDIKDSVTITIDRLLPQ